MARQEEDREDLMREATALSPRIELVLPGEAETLVAGSRADGRLSLYFGSDPAFHFDAEGRLRRAYCEGHLYRSQGTTLARLTRHRTAEETQLQRHDLNPAELEAFLRVMRERLESLRQALDEGSVEVVQEVPPEADFLPVLRVAMVAILAAEPRLARGVKGRG